MKRTHPVTDCIFCIMPLVCPLMHLFSDRDVWPRGLATADMFSVLCAGLCIGGTSMAYVQRWAQQ